MMRLKVGDILSFKDDPDLSALIRGREFIVSKVDADGDVCTTVGHSFTTYFMERLVKNEVLTIQRTDGGGRTACPHCRGPLTFRRLADFCSSCNRVV